MAGHLDSGHAPLMPGARSAAPIGKAAALAYGTGSLGTGLFSTVPSVLLLYYSTEILGVAPSAAALAILLPKLWSIIWDPYVGSRSDRATGRLGRRLPFMVGGAIGMALAFALLFSAPALSPAAAGLWVGFHYMALTSLYALFAVPYTAIPADIGDAPETTKQLVGVRMFFVTAGVLIGAALAPILVAVAGGGHAGYRVMGVSLAGFCLLSAAFPILMLYRHERSHGISAPPPLADDAPRSPRQVLRDSAFRRLTLGFLLQMIAIGALSATVPFVIIHGLGRAEADVGIAMGVMLGVGMAGLPAWSRIGRRRGLVPSMRIAATILAVSIWTIAATLFWSKSWLAMLACLALCGFSFSGLQLLPFTIAATMIQERGGQAQGAYTGVWTATEKLGLAVGAAIFGASLHFWPRAPAPMLAAFLALVPASFGVACALLARPRILAPRILALSPGASL